jgi:uroporphyrinogen decarboxylase
MNSCDRVLKALRMEVPDRVPYIELEIDEILVRKLFGKDYIEGNRINPSYNERTIVAEKALSKMIGRDNVCFPVRAPVLCQIGIGKDGRKFFGEGLIKTRDDLDLLLELPDPKDLEIVESAKKFVDEKEGFAACAIARLGIAPTILSMGFEGFALNLYDDIDFVMQVYNAYSEYTMEVFHAIRNVGFDFYFCSDDIAYKTGTFVSPNTFREIILPRLKEVAKCIPVPWVYHSDGNILPIIEDWLSLGQSGMHPIEPGAMDIYEMKVLFGKRICLVGNVEIDTLTNGTMEDVKEEVKEKIEVLAPGGGYIISSSNSLPNFVQASNVIAMKEAILEYGSYI